MNKKIKIKAGTLPEENSIEMSDEQRQLIKHLFLKDMMKVLGKNGGASRSAAKVVAAKTNGAKGGRPKKKKRNSKDATRND